MIIDFKKVLIFFSVLIFGLSFQKCFSQDFNNDFFNTNYFIPQITNNFKISPFQYLNNENNTDRLPPFRKQDVIAGITFGYSQPLLDLKGNPSSISLTDSSTSAKSYFMKEGFNAAFDVKMPFGKKQNFRIVSSFTWTWFTNNGSDSSGAYSVKPSLTILQLALGAEYAFSPFKEFYPFFGADLTANFFSGSVQYSGSQYLLTTNYNRAVRYGIAVKGGVGYRLSEDLDILLGARFNLANLLGKKSDLTGAQEINDAAYTVNGFSVNQKNIAFVNIFLGLSFNTASEYIR